MTTARLLALMLSMTAPARAGQPLVTDDAAAVTAKTCQVEAWVHSTPGGREYWAQPACNLTGQLELDLAGARAQPDPGESSGMIQLQAKAVLLTVAEHAWSFGASAGAARDAGAPHGRSAFQLYYTRALASWYPRHDLEIDLNLGVANAYGSGTFALHGAAVQYAIVDNVQLLGELFRDEPGREKYQVGVRCKVLPDRLEAYVSYGARFGGSDERSAVFGIRVQTAAFLP